MSWLSPEILNDERVQLLPLVPEHEAGLIEAAKDGELWKLWYTTVPTPDAMGAEIRRRLSLQETGSMLPYTILDRVSGALIGMTTFMNADGVNKRVEIGNTWYAKRAHRTGINRRCKKLMLAHAFEEWACIAVEFRTHFFNRQSRTAIERLGAKMDGILRNHMVMPDGTLRDTCVYSILQSEWPTVKSHLTYQVSRTE
ncbi:GNAT family N-acetyltransferase [Sneathiella limimaris]|uniref:GNAT family N-acetyltransferase n=1 Tax=Sneathiella limimaris TaxID=1964213 RepID=UPI00146B29BE|nr:GNAT family protein [Sneathiella limimaris]